MFSVKYDRSEVCCLQHRRQQQQSWRKRKFQIIDHLLQGKGQDLATSCQPRLTNGGGNWELANKASETCGALWGPWGTYIANRSNLKKHTDREDFPKQTVLSSESFRQQSKTHLGCTVRGPTFIADSGYAQAARRSKSFQHVHLRNYQFKAPAQASIYSITGFGKAMSLWCLQSICDTAKVSQWHIMCVQMLFSYHMQYVCTSKSV